MAQPDTVVTQPGCSNAGPDHVVRTTDQRGNLLTTLGKEVKNDFVPTPTYGELNQRIEGKNTHKSTYLRDKVPVDGNGDPVFVEACVKSRGSEELAEFLTDRQVCEVIVPAGTEPDAITATELASGVAASTITPMDSAHAVKRNLVGQFCPLTGTEVDNTTGLAVTVTRRRVPLGTVPTIVPGTDHQVVPVDCESAIETIRTLADYSAFSLEYCENISHTFPDYLEPNATQHYIGSAMFLSHRKRSAFTLNANRRGAIRKQVTARVVLTLHNIKPTPTALYQIIPVDHVYRGILFSINERRVLSDPVVVSANTNSRDTYYGFVQESVTLKGSTPTATDYVAEIGNEHPVAERIERWNYNLFARRIWYITLE